MHELINFIKKELKDPFKDFRKPYETKFDEKKIFYLLTQESPYYMVEE